MKRLAIVLAVAAAVAGTAACAAAPARLLGDPAAAAQAQRTIVIAPTTRYVNVIQGDVVKFVANGTTFSWNFDGPAGVSSFELNRVAPAGALDHPVTAYVAPNPFLYG